MKQYVVSLNIIINNWITMPMLYCLYAFTFTGCKSSIYVPGAVMQVPFQIRLFAKYYLVIL